MSISKLSMKTWITKLVAMLRAAGAPDVLIMLFTSMVITISLASGPPSGSIGTPLRGILIAGRSPHA
jgi:hypothetical protein